MNHLLCGYVEQKELKNVTPQDAKSLDVINVAFAYCQDSKIFLKNVEDFQWLPTIRSYNPDLKILFSVGGWGAGGFSPMSATEGNRRKFAASCLEVVKTYHLDGIDIDWEYPGLDWAGIEADPADKENYTKMFATIREVFDQEDPRLLLTAAVGCDQYFIDHTEMNQVAALLTYISIMTYDMRGCGEPFTGHHTNLYSYKTPHPQAGIRSVAHAVEIYEKAGVPRDKMVIGAAFYTRMWKNVQIDKENSILNARSTEPSGYGPGYGEISKNYLGKNGYVRYFDQEAQAPYLFNGSTFISYDDSQSITQKVHFLKKEGLRGIMYWEHSCDDTRELLQALHKEMKNS
jgi:chitinase